MPLRALAVALSLSALLLPHASHAQDSVSDRCVIRGTPEDVRDVTITPRGAIAFTVNLHRVSIEVLPARTVSAAVGFDANDLLRFHGTSRAVPFVLSRIVDAASGVLTLPAGTAVSRLRRFDSEVELTADLGLGVTARAVRAPCDSVTLDSPASPPPDSDRTLPEGDGTYWIPRGTTLVFRGEPGAGSIVRADVVASWTLTMRRIAHRHGCSRLVWVGLGGTRIDGWVADTSLRPMPEGDPGGIAPTGFGRAGCRDRHVDGARVYRGPATVVVGTPVYAEPGRGEWATIAVPETVQLVREGNEPWVRIVEIGGVSDECPQFFHAYVSAEWVRLPQGEHWR